MRRCAVCQKRYWFRHRCEANWATDFKAVYRFQAPAAYDADWERFYIKKPTPTADWSSPEAEAMPPLPRGLAK